MVGDARFELTASCTRNKRATKLRYTPIFILDNGRGRRTRTLGTWFWRPLLYQLSYTPILWRRVFYFMFSQMSIPFFKFLALSYNANVINFESFCDCGKQFTFDVGAMQFAVSNNQNTRSSVVDVVDSAYQTF